MKISIIGAGFVGSTTAYAMVLRRTASEIVLVDINTSLARAQAEDILHATPFSNPVKISAGGYEEIAGSAIVVLTCGVNQKPDESRLQLLGKNAQIFEEVTKKVLQHAPDAILLVASNPVDIMTRVVTKIVGGAPSRVIGSGTILDTARLRALLGDFFEISPKSVHAYVVGEHGDSEVLLWSSATAAGLPIAEYGSQSGKELTEQLKFDIDSGVRHAAYKIIEGKGSTYYGIGVGLTRIAQAIHDNEGAVLTVSQGGLAGFADVTLSLPRVIGFQGVVSTLQPALSEDERKALERSAEILDSAARGIGY
ncbi:MAG: L-lactate dehydrogenase [bacterium]